MDDTMDGTDARESAPTRLAQVAVDGSTGTGADSGTESDTVTGTNADTDAATDAVDVDAPRAVDPNEIRFRAGVRREGPFQVQYVTVHGYRRAYVKAGNGPAVLLVHGIGDSSDTWRPVLEQLAEDHTVIAPDLLGHGRSEKPRADYTVGGYANGMRDLLAVLEVDRATVVGHSLGGGVAAQFAYQFPERCERLVLVGSGGLGRTVSPLLRVAAVPGVEALMPLLGFPPVKLFSRIGASVLRLFDTSLGRDAEEILAVFDALPNTEARRAILRTLRSGVDWQGQVITMLDRAYLAHDVPTLIVWGRRDAIIPLGHARLARIAFPDSELVIFDEAGHFPHHTDPPRFARVVREFVAGTPPARYDPDAWGERLRRSGRRQPDWAAVELQLVGAPVDQPPDAD
jgi:pimeloyl-ACP methyl ester carboxylesterase